MFFSSVFDAFDEALTRAYDFKGYATRSEYFYFVIPVLLLLSVSFAYPFYYGISRLMMFNFGFYLLFGLFSQTNFLLTLSSLIFILLVIAFGMPLLSILSRRLNDCGLSGFYMILLSVLFLPLSLFTLILMGIVLVLITILTFLPSVGY